MQSWSEQKEKHKNWNCSVRNRQIGRATHLKNRGRGTRNNTHILFLEFLQLRLMGLCKLRQDLQAACGARDGEYVILKADFYLAERRHNAKMCNANAAVTEFKGGNFLLYDIFIFLVIPAK